MQERLREVAPVQPVQHETEAESPEFDPRDLGQRAGVLGILEGAEYQRPDEVAELSVEAATLSAYGKSYDAGVGSEG